MRVAVTGATGLVGSHSTAALIEAGHEVRLLARTPSKVATALGPLGVEPEQYSVIQGDIVDAQIVNEFLEGCDACLHGAAVVALRPADIPEAERINFTGARNVIGRAVEIGMDPIVHVSSASALFPPPGDILTADLPVTSPTSPYGKTKADCERYVRRQQDRGHPVVITYPGGVTGPHDPAFGPMASSLAAFIRGNYNPVPSAGGVMLIDVRDLAAAHAAVFETGRGPRRFMAGGNFLEWELNADLIDAALDQPLRRISISAGVILGMGRMVDMAMKLREMDMPLDYETAYYMVNAYPSDDTAIHEDLGVAWRPPGETYLDLIRWLGTTGKIPLDAPAETSQ
jgi:dihydroflavonol-4-reductase